MGLIPAKEKMKTIKVLDSKVVKKVESEDYNYLFNKENGTFFRWGKDQNDDPVKAPAPEILDIEISAGPCSQNCHFCFVPGTKISVLGKRKNIEDIKINDIVISYNEKLNRHL